ncbi:uncharacterized protein LOC128675460 [Plodia interpunctella]|uniref:uncharacterized protein LOC128675460 n=1 Tax=Plodia interpunctella TaxID=58824 RepID=UPI002367FC65|nr:uncharacterized protein LOC128675460 [Plodia interpunctella]
MCNCDSGTELGKTIAIYVLVCLVIVLSVLVAYLLYKIKTDKYSAFIEESTIATTQQTIRHVYTPQVSQNEETSLEIQFDTLKKKTEEAKALIIHDETDNANRLINPIKTPTTITPQINIDELKSHLMKTRHAIIHRDEIQKICNNELTKSQTLNKSYQDLKIASNNPKVKSMSKIEKSASANQLLEEDDEYDQFPTSIPVETVNDVSLTNICMQDLQSLLLERSKMKKPLSETGKTLSSPKLVQSDDEYDVLPPSKPVCEEVYDEIPSKNKVMHDRDTDYLTFISNASEIEPSYINANLNL